MARLRRTLLALSVAGSIAGSAGFVAFADAVKRQAPQPRARADAIVVLTGDEQRISTGMKLMLAGRARRMLISGVHSATRMPTELKRHLDGGGRDREALVKCCIDIGHSALNTSGNADEALQWTRTHGFRSLIVVTSAYHMPRSLIEFSRALPDVVLIPHPAMTARNLQLETWWRHWPTARLLVGEYVKFLGASARLGLTRLVQEQPPGIAPSGPDTRPAASATARTSE